MEGRRPGRRRIGRSRAAPAKDDVGPAAGSIGGPRRRPEPLRFAERRHPKGQSSPAGLFTFAGYADVRSPLRPLDCAGRKLLLDRPRVMGIVNVTPDSFSDGGAHDSTDAAVAHALRAGGARAPTCSTSAASPPVPAPTRCRSEEELRRVIPVIERLARETSLPISHRHLQARSDARGGGGRRRHDQRRLSPCAAKARWTPPPNSACRCA